MFLHIRTLLNEEQLESAHRCLEDAPFVEGQSTAGSVAVAVKRNLQLDRANARGVDELDRIITGALLGNEQFKSAVLPHKLLVPHYSKYTPGMRYGPHTDNPIMGTSLRIRSDLSITIFLNEPSDYEGGELVVQTDGGQASAKLPRGDAIVYETGALHWVNEITRGERLVAVTWIQSMIADPRRRRIVAELDWVARNINQKLPESNEVVVLLKNTQELIRLWTQM